MRKILSVIALVAMMMVPVFAETPKQTQTNEYYYVVTFKCSQSHLTLDLSTHLKDAMNKLEFEIPVDKDFYDRVRVGDKITDSFRMGSLIMKGSFGKWNVKVVGKKAVRK